MPFLKISKLALGALLASTLACSPVRADINIAAAANLTYALRDIISAFNTLGYANVFATYDSSGTLTNQIIANSPQYDLFLAADYAHPESLVTGHPSLVSGSPFLYAVGSLELWSPTVDISAGLPSPLTTNIVIANPSTAPYGLAASQVLASSPWNITTIPSGYVHTATNIGTTFDAIHSGTYAYGFVAQSFICRLSSGVQNFNITYPGTYHHSYLYNDASHPYSRILQYGIQVVEAGQDTTTLNAFISFLSSTTAQGILKSYCYQLS